MIVLYNLGRCFVDAGVVNKRILNYQIRKQTVNENGTREIAYTVDTDYPQDEDFFYQLNFWVLGVVVKFLPCVILTIISYWLIQALYR